MKETQKKQHKIRYKFAPLSGLVLDSMLLFSFTPYVFAVVISFGNLRQNTNDSAEISR